MASPYDKLVEKLGSLESASSAGGDDALDELRSMLAILLQAGRQPNEIRTELEQRAADGIIRIESVDAANDLLTAMSSEQEPTSPQKINLDSGEFNTVFGDDQDYASTTVLESVDELKKERDQSLQVGSVLRDRFLLQERVSGGSMGVVFKALDRRLAETNDGSPYVAIKVLSPQLSDDPKALRALQQEAAKGRFLSHPNIVRFIDLDRDEDMYFIVMEWLEGTNLADILDNSDALDLARAMKITKQIGAALDYAHNRGIVHADVKPANVMILPSDDAKLFDFGVARIRQQQDQESPGFNPGVLGALTPAYSSMQVLTGEDPVPQDDVFSLACLFYRLVAGHRVFGPRNAAEAAEAGMTPQPLSGLSDDQWKAIKKALSFSRVMRYDTVKQFLSALDVAPVDAPLVADRATRIVVDEELEDRSRAPLFVGLLAVGGLVAAYLGGVFDPWLYSNVLVGSPAQTTVAEPEPIPAEEVPAIKPYDAGQSSIGESAEDEAAGMSEIVNDADGETESAPEPTVDTPEPAIADSGLTAEDEPVTAPDDAVRVEESPVAFRERAPVELPQPDQTIRLNGGVKRLSLREGDAPVRIELTVPAPVAEATRIGLRETEFTGNRSPISSDELVLERVNNLDLLPGESGVQIVLSMTSDPVREADQQATVEVYDESAPEQVLATLKIDLEDDDQRTFEASLPRDTVAFAVGQVSVLESDTAVQVDLVRFNPGDYVLTAIFTVADVTATAEEDYFPPQQNLVQFAAGERSARVLIPLVQDAAVEGDEAFVLMLRDSQEAAGSDLYQRIVVMIRDDD